jgi:hypothetical protein
VIVIEQPKVEEVRDAAGDIERRLTHPAYALIRATRVTGHCALYGTDFIHNNLVKIAITRSALHRSVSHDWPAPGAELVEVAMSEAQWARLISSTGGVDAETQCTLVKLGPDTIPGLPPPKSRVDEFTKEMRRTQAKAMRTLGSLRTSIEDLGLSKRATERLTAMVEEARVRMSLNAERVVDQFDKHAEHLIDEAKTEVSAWMQTMIASAQAAARLGDRSAPPLPPLELNGNGNGNGN